MAGDLLTVLLDGGKKALADALASIEARPDATATIDLLDAAYHGAKGHVIGITGPPGVGKSTLITGLIKAFRHAGDSVGVIAIDPSSRRSGGALLGDRIRIETDPDDRDVFIRSMAARDRLGGLASITAAAVVLMRAVHDKVIVETVGVGQSETDITYVADSVLLCVQPGSGDSLQYMKAGIAEIPDIAVVTKTDFGPSARQTKRDLASALTATGRVTGSGGKDDWQVPLLGISKAEPDSVVALIEAIDRHWQYLAGGRLGEKRHRQAEGWVSLGIKEAYGREGLKVVMDRLGGHGLSPGQSPFGRISEIARALSIS